MNEPGFVFFYALAGLAMTLVIGVAIVMTLRQAIGARLSGFQIYLFRSYIYTSLWAVLFAMAVPSLLYMGMNAQLTISGVSAGVAIIMICQMMTNIARIHSYGEAVRPHLWLIHLGHVILALVLVVNALMAIGAIPLRYWASLSPITAAAFWELFAAGLDFAIGMPMVSSEPEKG